MLRAHGAVGDICLRFFDRQGKPVVTPLNGRVIGMELAQLRRASRVVGVAGGRPKTAAIRGALTGGLINVLITDRNTARRLVADAPAGETGEPRQRRRGAGRKTNVT